MKSLTNTLSSITHGLSSSFRVLIGKSETILHRVQYQKKITYLLITHYESLHANLSDMHPDSHNGWIPAITYGYISFLTHSLMRENFSNLCQVEVPKSPRRKLEALILIPLDSHNGERVLHLTRQLQHLTKINSSRPILYPLEMVHQLSHPKAHSRKR